MKAYQFSSGGTIDTLELVDVPTPRPGPGEVLLRMRAASLNYRDLLVVTGRYPRSQQARIIPLFDGAGEVVECGEGVSRLALGERVVPAFFPTVPRGEKARCDSARGGEVRVGHEGLVKGEVPAGD